MPATEDLVMNEHERDNLFGGYGESLAVIIFGPVMAAALAYGAVFFLLIYYLFWV